MARGAGPAAAPAYRLASTLKAGQASQVTVSLEVGGELIARDQQGQEDRLPLSVAAQLAYDEQLVAWWADAEMSSRSLRRYSQATATLKTDEAAQTLDLPEGNRLIVARADRTAATLNGLEGRLTRREFDLLNVVGNSLAIDRLLPDKDFKEGEGWDHDAATMGVLLDMDHVAVCEVRSVVVGEANRQVQVRMAGTVHGTIDGAASEMDLRGAYLFHLDQGRITKFNLAIKELRKPADVTAGLDVVAKLSLVAAPWTGKTPPFDEAQVDRARRLANDELDELIVAAPERGYRFRHNSAWYATAEHRELMSLRLLDAGDMIAHCNITTLPMRPADKPQTLQQFEADVAQSLGDKLQEVEAATEWSNEAGHQCLGVIGIGEVDGAPVQWRHYYVAADGRRPVTVSVTLEQSLVERFADADRSIVESMTLVAPPAATAKLEAVTK